MSDVRLATIRHWRQYVLALIPVAGFLIVLALDPIVQDHAYHEFADSRQFLGIPHFFNVVSNIFFLFIGMAGLTVGLAHPRAGSSWSWTAFFVGVLFIAFGSGYYHLAPDSNRLLWDRLPMTIAFMGLFVALLEECVHASLGRYLLIPAVMLGLTSIGWWARTGDLRLYGWIQFVPLLMIPVALSLFPPRYSHRRYLLYGLAMYALAKVAELYDREIFQLTGNGVSGHSLKHVLASVAILFVYLMLRRRRVVS